MLGLAVASVLLAVLVQEPDSPVRVGTPAPALGLEQVLQAPQGVPNGPQLGWGDLAGNIVVLEFWATWCGPCIASIPHLNELAEQFKDRPVRFISITDEDEQTVRKFLAKREIKGWIGLDTDGSMFHAYRVRGRPTTVMVDDRGVVMGIMSPQSVTAQLLEAVLAGERPKLPDGTGVRTVAAGVDPDNARSKESPVFQVVLRPSAGQVGMVSRGRGKLTAEAVSLAALVSLAWPEFSDGRTVFLGEQDKRQFTLIVSLPPGREGAMQQVLRDTLRQAFGLIGRVELREADVAVLTLPDGPGPGLREVGEGRGIATHSQGSFKMTHQEGSSIAAQISGVVGMPIDDRTGLGSRTFNIEVTWDPDDPTSYRPAYLRATGIRVTVERRMMEVLVLERE